VPNKPLQLTSNFSGRDPLVGLSRCGYAVALGPRGSFGEECEAELLYAFEDDLWPDAMFTVEIRNGEVRKISLDD
jgi:hypothetical protein